MTVQVVRCALDWFEHSFKGEVDATVYESLVSLKERAQAYDTPQPIMAGVLEMMVLPKAFGFWSFVLKHPEFDIRISPNAGVSDASASIRLSAFGLTNTDPTELWDRACFCLSTLGTYEPLTLSRVDVAADFQGWEPTSAEMSSVVCRASYRATHGTESAVQTFVFGKGAVVMRLYNKTDEIAESKKQWMKDAWSMTGRFDYSLPVWRVEVQLRRHALKELGFNTADRALDDPGALLDYGLKWANLRVPTGDETKTRWPEDPRWTVLRESVFGGVPLDRNPKLSQLMSLERATSQYVGAIATAAAYFETDDFNDANMRLAYISQVHMMEKDTDFAKLAEDKRRRALGGL